MIFTAINLCSGPLRKQKRLVHRSQKVMFVHCDWQTSIHFVGFCIFCSQLVVAVIMIDSSKTVNLCSGLLRKQNHLAGGGQELMFVHCDWQISIHFVGFCIFCGQLVVVVIMFDSSKTRKLLVGVEVQSPYVIERCSINLYHKICLQTYSTGKSHSTKIKLLQIGSNFTHTLIFYF